MPLTSDDVNALILQYLAEAGACWSVLSSDGRPWACW